MGARRGWSTAGIVTGAHCPIFARMTTLTSFPAGGLAIVIGASGGIGGALADEIAGADAFARTLRLSRRSDPPLDLMDEATIEAAAAHARALDLPVRLVVNATGFLHGDGIEPEKALSRLSREGLERNFALNAIGPALVLKHFVPLLARGGRSVFAALTAKVGSITDNELGGWYSYRASKAAHNQLIRTTAIETARRRPEALVVALHPGTVRSKLSEPFSKSGLTVQEPSDAASALLRTIDGLGADQTGTFHSYSGEQLPW